MAVIFSPAECDISCDDPKCPYTHLDVWHMTNGFGTIMESFTNEKDARAADDIRKRALAAVYRARTRGWDVIDSIPF